MSKYRYVVAEAVSGTRWCPLLKVENLRDKEDLREGVKMTSWGGDVRFHMNQNFPKMVQLADWVKNSPGAIIVSKQLRDFIEAAHPADVEYLPLKIIDHKGRVASADHFVLNPYKLQDAIDQKESTIKWNSLNDQAMIMCSPMVLDESRIDPGAKIFRLKHFAGTVLMERSLAEGIEQAGFTGVDFTDIEDLE